MAIASWLAESKVLTSDRIQDFSKTIIENGNLKSEIFKLLKHEKSSEKLDPVIHQLFSFYRLDNDLLQRFALEFLPTILCNYFLSICSAEQQNGANIEALLLGIYNIDAAKSQEEYLIDKTPPSSFLSIASVYHNPMHSEIPTQLTKVTLDKLQNKTNQLCHDLVHVESITNRNRLLIVSHSLMRYNQDIAYYSKVSHLDVCKLCSLLIKSTVDIHRTQATTSTLPVDENLLSHLLQSVFFIMYNDLPDEGYLALESLYFRAVYDLLPHTILAIGAVHNLLKSQGKTEGGLTLSAPLIFAKYSTPATKDAITAASFKPHILPEDIEVKDIGKETTASPFSLGVIGDESVMMKMRQKSVISKVFHIPKRKEEVEKKEEDKFPVSVSLSSPPPPSQTSSVIQFSMAKKALKNPFRSEQQTSTTSSAAASMARLEFLAKRDTITIAPYFSQLDASETAPNLPAIASKKNKSKGVKLRRKHLKRVPSSSSSSTTSPKHSLSVSSYLSKDVIQERNELTKSDVDDEEEEEEDEDEQVEGQDEINNESQSIVSTSKSRSITENEVLNFQNQFGRRQFLFRHITFAPGQTDLDQLEPSVRTSINRRSSDTEKNEIAKVVGGDDDDDDDAISSLTPLLSRKDSIPRLSDVVVKSLIDDCINNGSHGYGDGVDNDGACQEKKSLEKI